MKTNRTFLTLIVALNLFFKTGEAQPLPMNKISIDSLIAVLKTEKEDTNRVKTLYFLSRVNTITNTSASIEFGEQGIDLARKIKSQIGELKCLEAAAFTYALTGAWEKGLKTIYDGMALSRKIAPADEVYLLNMLSLLYQKLGDDKEAFINAEKAYRHPKFKESDIELGRWASVMQMGLTYEKLNNLDSAFYFAQKCDSFSKINYPVGEGYPLSTLSQIAAKRGNLNEAVDYAQQSLAIFKKSNFNYAAYEIEDDLAKVYYKQNKIDSAQYYATDALIGATQLNNYIVKRNSALLLSQIFNSKDPVKAYEYLKISEAAKDTINNLEKTKQFKLLELNEKKRVDDLHLSDIANANKLRQNTLLGILSSIGILALVLWRNNRQKQKANMLLQKQKEEIQNQRTELQKSLEILKATQNQLIQSEKLASLGELTAGIAHEIQNPLNFVNNFSELSVGLAKDIKDEIHKPEIDKPYLEDLLKDLTENQKNINHHGKRAASIVSGMLEHSRASTGKKELTDVNKLADEYFRLSYHGLRAKNKDFNAEMITHFDKTIPKIEIIPQDVGRVILNLINNAFYAVTQRKLNVGEVQNLTDVGTYQPTVTVSTLKTDNAIEIKVKDNGTGMPESVKAKVFQPFFTTKPTGQGTGLGLSLAYDIITKGHGGTLKVESTEGVGSEFIIQLSSKA